MAEEIEGQEPHTTPEADPTAQEGGDGTPKAGDELTPEQVADLKKRASASSQNFERLKKAEEELKKLKEEKKQTPPVSQDKRLSDEDIIYISKVDIHQDDLSDVREYAEKYGKTIKEAHGFLTPILEKRAEERRSAEASNTARSPRGTATPKGSDLLAQAAKGQLPSEDDDAGIRALVEAEEDDRREKAGK